MAAKNIESIYNGLFSMRASMEDLLTSAQNVVNSSNNFGGELSRIINEQMTKYFIPSLNKLIKDTNTPGSIQGVINFIDSVPLAMTRVEPSVDAPSPVIPDVDLTEPAGTSSNKEIADIPEGASYNNPEGAQSSAPVNESKIREGYEPIVDRLSKAFKSELSKFAFAVPSVELKSVAQDALDRAIPSTMYESSERETRVTGLYTVKYKYNDDSLPSTEQGERTTRIKANNTEEARIKASRLLGSIDIVSVSSVDFNKSLSDTKVQDDTTDTTVPVEEIKADPKEYNEKKYRKVKESEEDRDSRYPYQFTVVYKYDTDFIPEEEKGERTTRVRGRNKEEARRAAERFLGEDAKIISVTPVDYSKDFKDAKVQDDTTDTSVPVESIKADPKKYEEERRSRRKIRETIDKYQVVRNSNDMSSLGEISVKKDNVVCEFNTKEEADTRAKYLNETVTPEERSSFGTEYTVKKVSVDVE